MTPFSSSIYSFSPTKPGENRTAQQERRSNDTGGPPEKPRSDEPCVAPAAKSGHRHEGREQRQRVRKSRDEELSVEEREHRIDRGPEPRDPEPCGDPGPRGGPEPRGLEPRPPAADPRRAVD